MSHFLLACAPPRSDEQVTQTETGPDKGERRTPRFLEPAIGGLTVSADATHELVLAAQGPVIDQTQLVVDGRFGQSIGDRRVQIARTQVSWRLHGGMLAGRHRIQLSTAQVNGPDISAPISLIVAPAQEAPLRPSSPAVDRGAGSDFLPGQPILRHHPNEVAGTPTWVVHQSAQSFLVIDRDQGNQRFELRLPVDPTSLDALAVARGEGQRFEVFAHSATRPDAIWHALADQDMPSALVFTELAWPREQMQVPVETVRWRGFFGAGNQVGWYGEGIVDTERPERPRQLWALAGAGPSISLLDGTIPHTPRLRPVGQSLAALNGELSIVAELGDGAPAIVRGDQGDLRLLVREDSETLSNAMLDVHAAAAVESSLGEHTMLVVDNSGTLHALGLDLELGLVTPLPILEQIPALSLPLAQPPLPAIFAGTPYFFVARPSMPVLVVRSNGAQLRLQALPFSCDKLLVSPTSDPQSLQLYCLSHGNVRRNLLTSLPTRRGFTPSHDLPYEDQPASTRTQNTPGD